MKGFPPERIVAAVDLSPASLSALDAAKVLALTWGSALEVVRVRQPALVVAGIGPDAMPVPLPENDEQAERRAELRLRAAVSGLPGVRASVRTIKGWPVHELLEQASSDADLLVLGTHGYAGLDRALHGSIAEAVVRRCRAPVLALRASNVPFKATRILAPWNGRPYATRALRYARRLAHSLGAELHVLHVVPNGLSIDETEPGLGRRIESILGPGREPAWSLRVRIGEARAHIIQEANSGRYGLVVISAHRRPFSSDIVLGSTVERLLRHCRIPILAYPSGRTLLVGGRRRTGTLRSALR